MNMNDWLDNTPALRLPVFLGTLMLMLLLERLAPRRMAPPQRRLRCRD
jgi:hypothetical protein